MSSVTSASSKGTNEGPTGPTTIAADCAGRSDLWLRLYEYPGFGGRVLQFNDVGYWQNLANYGFSRVTSSWVNSTYCTAYIADGTSGGGARLTLGSGSSQGSMGSWDNRAVSLYISG